MSARADLIITGRVATLAGDSGLGWVEAIAIESGRVIAAGHASEVEALAGPRTRTWRLPNELLVLPGITDAHLHLITMTVAEQHIDVTGKNLDQTLAAVAQRHETMNARGDADGWLLGHGWSMDLLGRWPTYADLDRAAPGRAIALVAHDHHSRWVSGRVLDLAGVANAPQTGVGALVQRDDQGYPTGILLESSSIYLDPVIPSPSREQLESSLERVCAELLSLGLTGVHDPGELTGDTELDRGPLLYRALAESGRLPMRVHSSVRAPQLQRAFELGFRSGESIGRYRSGWLKLFADGSLGSRNAALLAPYDDAAPESSPGNATGMVMTDAEELTELLTRAGEAGISGQVHAIGDAAVRMALDVYESLPPTPPLMRRIEHAQLVDPADVPRFGRLGVAASVQPVHLRSDAEPARVAWGDRAENTFPLAGLVSGGALIPLGTDAPVEPADPWPGIAVAVVRREPFKSEDRQTAAHQRISLERAIRAACVDPASVAAQPDVGRLTPGCRADLIVVPANSLREPFDAAAFAATRPVATLLDGEVVFRSTTFEA